MSWVRPVVILDLDDTLIDYTGAASSCWQTICDETAPSIGAVGAQLHAAVMDTRTWYWADLERNRLGRANPVEASRQIVTLAFERLGIIAGEHVEMMALAYQQRRRELVTIFPESVEVVETLRARGHRLAMITNGATATQRDKIERFDLGRLFDHLLVEGEFGIGKPDARVYQHVLGELGVSADQAVMVGDDLERDVAGPQRAGMLGVWIDRAGAGVPASSTIRPDRIIRSLTELL
jgi:putative hydrolase of the HAD superfamily